MVNVEVSPVVLSGSNVVSMPVGSLTAERSTDPVKSVRVIVTVAVVDCPVDYSENMKLTARLKSLASPLDE